MEEESAAVAAAAAAAEAAQAEAAALAELAAAATQESVFQLTTFRLEQETQYIALYEVCVVLR